MKVHKSAAFGDPQRWYRACRLVFQRLHPYTPIVGNATTLNRNFKQKPAQLSTWLSRDAIVVKAGKSAQTESILITSKALLKPNSTHAPQGFISRTLLVIPKNILVIQCVTQKTSCVTRRGPSYSFTLLG